jgi:[protein-PII] uridylyltransferase
MRLREQLGDWSAEEFDAYAARHYPHYWLKVDAAQAPVRIASSRGWSGE